MSLPDRCPFAIWTHYNQWPTGDYTDDVNLKAVWHKTQGYDNVITAVYPKTGGIPKLTILSTGVLHQHYSMNNHDRGLRNLPGGVQTNLDGAISIEIVGFTGKDVTTAQRFMITRLTTWLSGLGIPGVWLNGAPIAGRRPTRLTPTAWDNGNGHCGHIDVPENNHTDPGFTPSTLAAVEAGFTGEPDLIPHAEWRQAYNDADPDVANPIVTEVQMFLAGRHLYTGNIDGLKATGTDLAWTGWETVVGVPNPNPKAGGTTWAAYERAKFLPPDTTELDTCNAAVAETLDLLAASKTTVRTQEQQLADIAQIATGA